MVKNGTYRYAIELASPMGPRHGGLELYIHDGSVDGALTLFRQTMPICTGSCAGDSVRFAGEMKTLMYSLPYTAEGTVGGTAVELLFRTDKGCFSATGIADNMSEGEKAEV